MSPSLLQRLHNPTARVCGCSSMCVCQRTRLGRAFRWYIPGRFHMGLTAAEKQQREFR